MNNERRPPMGPRHNRPDDRRDDRRDDRWSDRDPRRGGPPRRPGQPGQHGQSGGAAGERRFGGGARRGPGGMSGGPGGQHRQGGRGGSRRPAGGRPGAHRPGGGRRREREVEVESDELLSGPIEANYLRELVSAHTPIQVKLRNGQTHSGTIEYWDQRFIRLTPPSGPNLFIFKHDIKYLLEITACL